MTDTDLMPFGKYEGKQLKDVPFEYLKFMHNHQLLNPKTKEAIALKAYCLKRILNQK